MNYEKIGKFIAQLRKTKKLTQEDLAKKLNVDRGTVSKWERGVYLPNTEMLLKLQDLFDVTINEILYGEKKDADNVKNIENVPIVLMNENSKKVRKILFSSIIIILFLLVSFLVYYFFNNYNSIKIYRIHGNEDRYSIRDGIMIISKEKVYIKLGKIENNTNKKIVETRLFYIKNGKEKTIFSDYGDSTDILLINKFNYNEYFNSKDIKFIMKNLYLEIVLDDKEKKKIELKLEKDFSNDNLFSRKKMKPISDGELNDVKTDIPKYVKDNFKYDSKELKYYKEKDNYLEEYFPNVYTYVLTIKKENGVQVLDCSTVNSIISFYNLDKGKMTEYFTYDVLNKKCLYGNCQLSELDFFTENYYKKLQNTE